MKKIEKRKKLIEIRIKNNYTYDDMAKKLGMSKSNYWKIENGYRNIYYETAKQISKIFSLKPDDLFYED